MYINNNLFGIETIAMQKDNILVKIAKHINDYRSMIINESELCTLMGDTLTNRFGLTVTFNIINIPVTNAWVNINTYVKTHPLYTTDIKNIVQYDRLVGGKDAITAIVDLKKAYISGSIQKYNHDMTVTGSLLNSKFNSGDYQFTDNEIAAILLHEMGHLFTFIEYLLYTTKMNVVVDTITQKIVGIPKEQRIKIINSDSDLKKFPTDITNDLIDVDNKELIEVIIIKGLIREVDAQAGMTFYSARYMEQAADMFTIKCGGGKYLAVGLSKILYRNKYQQIVMTILEIISSVSFVLMVLLILIPMTDDGRIYDNDRDRLKFVRNQYVDMLKSANTINEKENIIRIIKEIDDAMAKLSNEPFLISECIAYVLSSRYRSVKKQEKSMKDIENMINNDLYVSASKLNILEK